jgi:TPP-dependent pyruvate/acetoin dehydrogenase alpha subunit
MVTKAGTRAASATAHGKHGHSLISEGKFRQLHGLALKAQQAGRSELRLRGQEAALTGVLADLQESDVVVLDPAEPVAGLRGGGKDPSGNPGSFEARVIDALSRAVGDRMRKTGRITAIFFSGAEASQLIQEARSLAIGAKLPVLLVEHASAKRRTNASKGKGKKAGTLEYPSIPVDMRDVIAMYRVAHEAIERARDGGGPTHIVSVPWELPADKRGGRAKIATPDAVAHLEEWLMARGLPAAEWRREIAATVVADQHREQTQGIAAAAAIQGEDTEARAIA